jgi:hypothetical protein
MTSKELYYRIISQLQLDTIHPLHKAILEECCETALNNKQSDIDEKQLVFGVQLAFLTSNSILN